MKNFNEYIFWPLNIMTAAFASLLIFHWNTVHLSWVNLFWFLMGWTWISGFGVSVALHRVFTHKTHRPKPWLKEMLLMCATLSCEGSTIAWCALHRGTHHPYSDSAYDPQSPWNNSGLWNKLQGWKVDLEKHVRVRTVPDLLRDRDHVWYHENYVKVVWFFWVTTFLVIPDVFVFGVLFPTFLSVWGNNLETVLSHCPKLGYRNFDLGDKSTNIWWMWPFGWGACALHNNHHKFPAQYNFRHRWWEVDPSMIFLPLLRIGSIKKEQS